MKFNPDPKKNTRYLSFSKKSKKKNSLPVAFNNTKVVTCFKVKWINVTRQLELSPFGLTYSEFFGQTGIYFEPKKVPHD